MIGSLSVQEKKVLRNLEEKADVAKLAQKSGMDQSAVMRAALSLNERGLITINELKSSIAVLTPEGAVYAREGTPERKMLVALASSGGETVDDVAKRASLPDDQVQIALAWVRRKGWVEFAKRDEKNILAITEKGAAALSKKSSEEELLERLEAGGQDLEWMPQEILPELENLERRGLIEIEDKTTREIELTALGREATAAGVELVEEISDLTSDMIKSWMWRGAKLRRYDVLAPGAPIYPGKSHPQQQVIDELREILLQMGFTEISSRIVESEFWNFDALFQAQDHPAREIHDSLSVSNPEQTKLPPPDIFNKVARAHEKGTAGSTGWGYNFSKQISQRPVLCSQTTAATVRYLASKPKPPVKVFCISRVYRHEKIDYKHLAEFYQCEGIVMDKGLTLRNMHGYLKQIVGKLGLEKIRFRPGYFPYTEPSTEADVYFPDKGEWLEILGAGMFRPELLKPLGINYPVLAWGIGFSRLAMLKLGINDIRELYKNDLDWLQEKRMI